MKKLFLILCSISAPFFSLAQQEGSAFTSTGRAVSTTFARDYESIDINPANLAWGTGWEGKKITLGFLEFGASAFSNALTKDQLFNSSSENFDKKQAAIDFASSGTAFNVDIAPINFAFTNETFGGIAVNTKDRFQFFAKLNEQTADILVNGFQSSYFDSLSIDSAGIQKNVANDPSYYNQSNVEIIAGLANDAASSLLSDILDGTSINLSYTREYNVSYGRYLVNKEDKLKIGGGIGLKYIQGFGVLNIGTDNDGNLEVFSSISPDFGVDVTGQGGTTPNIKPFMTPVGSGFGVDLGLNMVLKKKIHLGLSVTNLGSIKWTGEAYTVKDTLFTRIESGGFESYDVASELSTVVADGDLFEFEEKSELNVALPSVLRLGGSLDLKKNTVHIGADVVIPLNDAPGSFEKPIIGLGGDFRIIKWLEFDAGLSYGGNTQQRLNVPLGVTAHIGHVGVWEAGVASRDIVTWFRNDSPNLSAAVGFLRFRI